MNSRSTKISVTNPNLVSVFNLTHTNNISPSTTVKSVTCVYVCGRDLGI